MYRSIEQHRGASSRLVFPAAVVEELQQRMCECDGAAMSAFRPGLALSNGVDKCIRSRINTRILKCRPRSAWIDAGMIIGAADKPLEPWSVSFWGNAMPGGKPFDDFRSERSQECGRQFIHGL